MLDIINSLRSSFRDLRRSYSRLSTSIADLKQPENPEVVIERISASKDGRFVLESGFLSPEELGKLSRKQLAKLLAGATRMVEMFGNEAFIQAIPEMRKGVLKEIAKGEKAGS